MSTPSEAIDYFISLDTELEGANGHYNEQLVRAHWVQSAAFQSAPNPLLLPQGGQSEGEGEGGLAGYEPLSSFGVMEGAHAYLVLGRLFKLHPRYGM